MSIFGFSELNDANGNYSSSPRDIYAGLTRKWVEFNGTGTVSFRNGYGVSSMGDRGTGVYQVNFIGNMPTASYVVFGTTVGSTTGSDRSTIQTEIGNTKQVNYCRLEVRNIGTSNSLNDADYIGVGFLGAPN